MNRQQRDHEYIERPIILNLESAHGYREVRMWYRRFLLAATTAGDRVDDR